MSTGSLYNWSLDRVFDLAGRCGYDGVELLVDARMDSYEVPYLRGLVERWGISILSVHTPFAARLEGWPAAPEGRLQQAARLAEQLGAETVVAHAPLRWSLGHVTVALGSLGFHWPLVLPWRDRAGARYAAWLQDSLAAFQAESAVRIALENMPARRLFGRRLDVHGLSSVEALGHFPYLVLDTTHWATHGVDPLQVYEAAKGRIVHVHLANYDGREHRLPHKGHLALGRLLGEMAADGFAGIVAVEAEPGAVGEGGWGRESLERALWEAQSWVRAGLARPSSHSHTGNPAAAEWLADRGE